MNALNTVTGIARAGEHSRRRAPTRHRPRSRGAHRVSQTPRRCIALRSPSRPAWRPAYSQQRAQPTPTVPSRIQHCSRPPQRPHALARSSARVQRGASSERPITQAGDAPHPRHPGPCLTGQVIAAWWTGRRPPPHPAPPARGRTAATLLPCMRRGGLSPIASREWGT